MTPAQASRRGRLGALALHAKYDARELTKPAREAFLSRFEREVNPTGQLDPAERRRRAEYAKRSYFIRLAEKSAAARRQRASM